MREREQIILPHPINKDAAIEHMRKMHSPPKSTLWERFKWRIGIYHPQVYHAGLHHKSNYDELMEPHKHQVFPE